MEKDLLICNARIYTVDSQFNIAGSMLISGNKIKAVFKDPNGPANAGLKRVDMGGRYIYPGLIDPHSHFLGYGLSLSAADLTGSTSPEDMLSRLQKFASENSANEGDFLEGRGWDQNLFPGGKYPDKSIFDKAFPNRPVFLTRIDGHAALVNEYALKMAGVHGNENLTDGKVELVDGKPSGLLIDNAMELVRSHIPLPTHEELQIAALKAQKNCFSVGLTSVCDAGLPIERIELLRNLQNEGDLNIRLYTMLNPDQESKEWALRFGPFQSDSISINGFKYYADGALGSRGARLLEPYTDQEDTLGIWMNSSDYFKKEAEFCLSNGFQMITHCIGDAANRMTLNLYGEFLKGTNNRRWRIEHAQILKPEDISLFGKYSVIPSIQTTHATSDMPWAEQRLGPGRMRYAYPCNSFLEHCTVLPNGSDFPIESINPLLGYYAAISRKSPEGFPESGFRPEECLSREDALKAMTIWSAYANFEDHVKGSIESGKLADFIVLEEDLLRMEENRIPKFRVSETWLNGEQVYLAVS